MINVHQKSHSVFIIIIINKMCNIEVNIIYYIGTKKAYNHTIALFLCIITIKVIHFDNTFLM